MPNPRMRHWPMFSFLITALVVTLVVAVVGWFRPVQPKPPPPPTYNAKQIADAKAQVCAAHEKVHNAIKASSARDRGTDPTAQLVFAINGQQAILAGSEFLRTTLSQQPATPDNLANTVRKLTDIFQGLVVDYQNGMSDSELESTLRASDDATVAIQEICK
jgi:cytoskeletal protein RodZ